MVEKPVGLVWGGVSCFGGGQLKTMWKEKPQLDPGRLPVPPGPIFFFIVGRFEFSRGEKCPCPPAVQGGVCAPKEVFARGSFHHGWILYAM